MITTDKKCEVGVACSSEVYIIIIIIMLYKRGVLSIISLSRSSCIIVQVLLSDETDTGCVFKIFTYSHRHQSLGEEVTV